MTGSSPIQRLRVEVRGVVQGVGFRPHAYRLARELGLAGSIRNDCGGVRVEVEGPAEALSAFEQALVERAPRSAQVDDVRRALLPAEGARGLEIQPSQGEGSAAGVQADLAPCDECLAEVFDPNARRHRYPFTSCTQCGPRFSILEALPYDRENTTLRRFPLCPDCRAEFEDPGDRRFHAQPLACPACGPQLRWLEPDGSPRAERDDALGAARSCLEGGGLVALKGRGGYQLVCRADAEGAVERTRTFKQRPRKPLALMASDLESAHRLCELTSDEAKLLSSPAAPIVLARRRPGLPFAEAIAPGLPTLGVMLPSTPLHHLLLEGFGPLVVTSGNRRSEPMWTDDGEAFAGLGPHVDGLLVHDRPIANLLDDSVARWAAGRPLLLRRARGYVPLAVPLGPGCAPAEPVLAQGGHLKAVLAVSEGERAWVSQHVGDLDGPRARAAYGRVEEDLLALRRLSPPIRARDLHPDYATTRRAEEQGGARVVVQHHEAHVLSVLAEHGLSPPALGIAWDGTGYGPDGTVWGGEALAITETGCERVARLRPFPLPGGERAVREPRRSALGLLWSLDEDGDGPGRDAVRAAFSAEERRVLLQALRREVNSPWTSSVGRLFDGVASLTGLIQRSHYEAEAATALEQAADPSATGAYPFALDRAARPWELDWRPALRALLADVAAGEPLGAIAARFHRGLAEAVALLAEAQAAERVILSGGCFANRLLLEATIERLRRAGRSVDWPRLLPPGDGGLALGQLAAAARQGC